MTTKTIAKKPALKIALPVGITEKDLTMPSYKDKDKLVRGEDYFFEIWYTEKMGWIIPTLLISRAKRFSNRPDRTYGTTLDGRSVRVGKGPHVLAQHNVYVRESRLAKLQTFLDLRKNGQVASNEIRDRISSRRAQGQLNRAKGLHSWMWEV